MSTTAKAIGTSLALVGIVVAFLAGMYLMHPAAAATTTVSDSRYGAATTTSTIFVTSTGTVDVTKTVNMTETVVSTVTDPGTSTSSSSSSSSCSQSLSLPSGSYTDTENVHLSLSACSKAVILVGPRYNPDEYTITCNGSCLVLLENMPVNTYYVSVSTNGNVYTS